MMTFNEMKLKLENIKVNSNQANEDFYNLLASRAVCHKYYDRPVLSLFPYEIEYYGGKPGKEIKQPYDKTNGYYKCFFDGDGRIIISEGVNGKGVVINRQFVFYSPDIIESYYFTKVGAFKAANYSVLPLKKGLPEKLFNIGPKGQSIWDFIYDEGVLKKIEVNNVTDDDYKKAKDVHFLYGASGLVEIVYDYLNGEKQSIYKNKLKSKK
ncbi:hypothetical protein [Cronobacter sakazakii]|uniref:hypothetical protein n=1 Tax=Cronobacter sakazakii TaxID=28141 RepID=UPI003CEF738E